MGRKSKNEGSETAKTRDRDDQKERNYGTRDRYRYSRHDRENSRDVEKRRYMHCDRDNKREKDKRKVIDTERADRDKERERKEREKSRLHSGVEEKEKKRHRRDYDDKIRDVREGSQETKSRSRGDDNVVVLKENVVEEHKILEDDMERKRKKEDEVKPGKTWTLDGESDDEESAPDGKSTVNVVDDNNEYFIDPLDAYMETIAPQVDSIPHASELAERNGNTASQQLKKGVKRTVMGRIIQGEDSGSDYDNEDVPDIENDEQISNQLKKTKIEKLANVDHSKMDYPPFRKNLYAEVKEIVKMTPEEVASYRLQLELKIRGKNVPKPIKLWHQTGLSTKVLDTIRKLDYEKPMSIQAQALPVIMSGRDCIGIAKTGSGKTLAFVLPMLRHIKDQTPLMSGDGPIGLIIAPTRELVRQIHADTNKFVKKMGLTCVPVYGGTGVAQQYNDLKRGAEIVVCTPGRMIDVLCTGKITNLRRVTYLVMDEADRMFDMGFEPQITRIVHNTRPDRQTVLFSATFPHQVETLARKVLNEPVKIQVGGRSVVNKDITQFVEVRPEGDRFLRLLELLGEWSDKGKVLIFVRTQDKCDSLFAELVKAGYPCLSLHGAKDQSDRESTIADFKNSVCSLLIATSIAARGLDVKELELVINFDVPDHYEDYVHRVGRTGRAGRKGCAITFISEEDARYAPGLVKALALSEQSVPADLKALADGFNGKVYPKSGYTGKGFKFNKEEEEDRKAIKKAQGKEYMSGEDISESEDEKTCDEVEANTENENGGLPVSVPRVLGLTVPQAVPTGAAAFVDVLKHNLAKIQVAMPEHYEAELEINDFPRNARCKFMHKETLGRISDWTGAAIMTRGQYYEPGNVSGRKLYLFIEGPTEQSVKNAKTELKRVLEDITIHASSLPGSAQQSGNTITHTAALRKAVGKLMTGYSRTIS